MTLPDPLKNLIGKSITNIDIREYSLSIYTKDKIYYLCDNINYNRAFHVCTNQPDKIYTKIYDRPIKNIKLNKNKQESKYDTIVTYNLIIEYDNSDVLEFDFICNEYEYYIKFIIKELDYPISDIKWKIRHYDNSITSFKEIRKTWYYPNSDNDILASIKNYSYNESLYELSIYGNNFNLEYRKHPDKKFLKKLANTIVKLELENYKGTN